MNYLKLYTDGACSGNPGPGGFGFAIINDEDIIYSNNGSFDNTTNNKMELLAVVEGIKYILYNFDTVSKITIFTDSAYTMNSITNWAHNWKKNDWKKSDGKIIENKDLIVELYNLCYNKNLKVDWVKVKAHQSKNSKYYDRFNDYVDNLATGKINPKNS